jgi:hypothetical protein
MRRPAEAEDDRAVAPTYGRLSPQDLPNVHAPDEFARRLALEQPLEFRLVEHERMRELRAILKQLEQRMHARFSLFRGFLLNGFLFHGSTSVSVCNEAKP